MSDIICLCCVVHIARSMTERDVLSVCVLQYREFVNSVLSMVRRGSAGCSACAVGAMRCLWMNLPFFLADAVLTSLIHGSHDSCLALKSPTTTTGRGGDDMGEGLRG